MTRDLDPRAFKPRSVAVTGSEIAVAWADGHESYLPFPALRRACPCALCRSEARREPDSGPLRTVHGPRLGDLTVARIAPVGAYAIQIVWSDGHDTGIHSYESLRRLCSCPACEAERSGGD